MVLLNEEIYTLRIQKGICVHFYTELFHKDFSLLVRINDHASVVAIVYSTCLDKISQFSVSKPISWLKDYNEMVPAFFHPLNRFVLKNIC